MDALAILLKEYWGVFLFVSGLVFHSIHMYFRVGNLETRIKDIEDANTTQTTLMLGMKEELARMNAKLEILLTGYNSKK
jgi:hypothetical protein